MSNSVELKIGDCRIKAFHLKNFLEHTLGLMFRNGGNALFEFKREGKYGVWMVFTKFPIDLAFLNEDKKIVEVIKGVPPISLNPKTWKIYYPKEKCKYILELDSRRKIILPLGIRVNW